MLDADGQASAERASCQARAQILRKQGAALDTKMARVIAVAVARGMAYLHGRKPPLLHLDLKVGLPGPNTSWV